MFTCSISAPAGTEFSPFKIECVLDSYQKHGTAKGSHRFSGEHYRAKYDVHLRDVNAYGRDADEAHPDAFFSWRQSLWEQARYAVS